MDDRAASYRFMRLARQGAAMNFTRRWVLLILAMAGWMAAVNCIASEPPTVVYVVADEEKRGGYLVEIMAAAFKKVGYQAEFDYVPWARALNETIQGKYPVLLAAYYSDERARVMSYSEPIGSVEVYF
jgi:polar amino acid transport system substrate-binding protein